MSRSLALLLSFLVGLCTTNISSGQQYYQPNQGYQPQASHRQAMQPQYAAQRPASHQYSQAQLDAMHRAQAARHQQPMQPQTGPRYSQAQLSAMHQAQAARMQQMQMARQVSYLQGNSSDYEQSRAALDAYNQRMAEQKWNQMRQNANSILMQRAQQTRSGQTRSGQTRGMNASYNMRSPAPNGYRNPQSASQDDPFGEVVQDPFGNDVTGQQRDPFGDPPQDAQTPPPAQRDPFGNGDAQAPSRDPFGNQPQQQPIDPFAEPPADTAPIETAPRQPQMQDPILPGGVDNVPQVSPGNQQLPTAPIETQQRMPVQQPPAQQPQMQQPPVQPPSQQYPPESVTPPSDPAPRQPTQQEPSPANNPPEARPISPTPNQTDSQTIPDSVVPVPRFTEEGQVGSPGPYTAPAQQAPPATNYNYPSQQTYPQYPQGYAPGQVMPPVTQAPGSYPPVVAPSLAPVVTAPPVVQGHMGYDAYPMDHGQVYAPVVQSNDLNLAGDYGCADFNAAACLDPQFYLSVFGGISEIGSITEIANAGIGQNVFDFDDGYGVGFAVGSKQGRNLRTEFDFAFREFELLSLDNSVTGPGNTTGDLAAYSGMFNFYWEFMSFPNRCWKPYVGGGLGFVFLEPAFTTGGAPETNGDDSSFAYQFMAGVNYKFSRRTDLFAEYRYFAADDIRIDSPTVQLSSFDVELDDIFFGIRLKF